MIDVPSETGIMATGRPISVRNPRSGEADYTFHAPTDAQLCREAARLRAAQGRWAAAGSETRFAAMDALADALTTHRASLHRALADDTGRSRIASIEIESVIRSARAWRGICARLDHGEWKRGRSMPSVRHRAREVPYPLVTVISPWNFPLLLAMIDALPALAAGCAVWIKPSEVAPRFAEPLAQLVAGIADLRDVLSIVPGDGPTAETMIGLGDCVCFTGSVATGRRVAEQAAKAFIPAYLELGGKDPMIVLDGADLEAATDAALRGSVLATGQACQSIERLYVARPIHDEFVDRLCAKARAVRFNQPDPEVGDIGPIIFDRQALILEMQIADARAKGARVLTGGVIERHGGGLWLAPTVITAVDHRMSVMREETFGPIMPVMPFDDVDQAVSLANDGEFGLSAAVFGPTGDDCERVAERLEAGAISVNDAALTALFHEAGKQSFRRSGLGPPRMGLDGYTRFVRRQAIIVNEAAPLPLAAFREEG